ncbi:hypothetical protein N300_10971, partial [Calypte anna]
LTTEAVEGTSLALKRVHYVHGRHGLPLGVLGVGNSVANHVLQKHLQHAARLLVDQARDALHAATPSQAADSRLSNALDIVAQHLAVTLSTSFTEPLPAL